MRSFTLLLAIALQTSIISSCHGGGVHENEPSNPTGGTAHAHATPIANHLPSEPRTPAEHLVHRIAEFWADANPGMAAYMGYRATDTRLETDVLGMKDVGLPRARALLSEADQFDMHAASLVERTDIEIAKSFLHQRIHEQEHAPTEAGAPLGRDELEFYFREYLAEGVDGLLARCDKQIAEQLAELNARAKRIAPSETWETLIEHLSEDYVKTNEGLLAATEHQLARADAFYSVHKIIPSPGRDFVLIPYDGKTLFGPVGAYNPPDPILNPGDKPGKFTYAQFNVDPTGEIQVSPPDLDAWWRRFIKDDLAATVIHESALGHHVQWSTSLRHPSFARKIWHLNGLDFMEGWGRYTEVLSGELGLLNANEQLFTSLWRYRDALATRSSIRMNLGLVSRDATIELLVREGRYTRNEAEQFTSSWLSSPLAVLGLRAIYLVGVDRILTLRERFRELRSVAEESHDQFLLRFHTELLSHGMIALPLMEREMFGQ